MAKMTIANFKARFAEVASRLDSEGVELVTLPVTGAYETELLGFWTKGAAPWDLDPTLAALMESDDVLKNAMTSRPLFYSTVPLGFYKDVGSVDALSTFDAGNLFNNTNLSCSNVGNFVSARTIARSAGLQMLGDISDILRDAENQPKLRVSVNGQDLASLSVPADPTVFPAQGKNLHILDVTDLTGMDQYIETYGTLMGVRSRAVRMLADGTRQKGKVFLMTASNAMSGLCPSSLKSDSTLELDDGALTRSNHAAAFVAGDVSYVIQWFPRYLNSAAASEAAAIKCVPYEKGQDWFALVIETPLAEQNSIWCGIINGAGWGGGHTMLNTRYNTQSPTTIDYTPGSFKSSLCKLIYGDVDVMFRGEVRKLWDFPAVNHSAIVGKRSYFYPLIGMPPQIHSCFLGVRDPNGPGFTAHEWLIQVDRDWVVNYQTSAYGRVLKKMSADKVKEEWPDTLPSKLSISFFSQPEKMTEEDIKRTNLARRYAKSRDQACKTDNFMTLEYAKGETYRDVLNKILRTGGVYATMNYTESTLVAPAQRTEMQSVVNVAKVDTTYECTINATEKVVIPFSGATSSDATREECLVYVSRAIVSGGKYPNTYATDLAVPPSVVTELNTLKAESKMGDTVITGVTTPGFVSGTTNLYHTYTAIPVSGFTVPNILGSEQRVDALLYSSLSGNVKTISSMRSIMSQFANSNYNPVRV